MIVTLNIGLWINGEINANYGPATVLRDVLDTLNPITLESKRRFAKSGEPTMVITMMINSSMAELHNGIMQLCRLFNQDCIALTVENESGLHGHLFGPVTEPYGGEFNPEYFIAY